MVFLCLGWPRYCLSACIGRKPGATTPAVLRSLPVGCCLSARSARYDDARGTSDALPSAAPRAPNSWPCPACCTAHHTGHACPRALAATCATRASSSYLSCSAMCCLDPLCHCLTLGVRSAWETWLTALFSLLRRRFSGRRYIKRLYSGGCARFGHSQLKDCAGEWGVAGLGRVMCFWLLSLLYPVAVETSRTYR
jgi:hypothetical protein